MPEQPNSEREQITQPETNDQNVPPEDFEAGVLNKLDSLYRTARRMTSNQQEAEDLVQETMLKAFRFANTYQRGTNLRAWLFRILNTSAINRYRKQASHPTPTSLPEGEDFYLYNRIKDLTGQELSIGAEDEVLSQYLDEDVYKALKAFADTKPNLSGEDKKLFDETMRDYRRAGLALPPEKRKEVEDLRKQLAKERGYVRSEVK